VLDGGCMEVLHVLHVLHSGYMEVLHVLNVLDGGYMEVLQVLQVLLTRVRQRSLLCMFRSASDAIILSTIPRCLLHSSCRMRVRADACARKYHAYRAHKFPYVVQFRHTHMCTRPSINICTPPSTSCSYARTTQRTHACP